MLCVIICLPYHCSSKIKRKKQLFFVDPNFENEQKNEQIMYNRFYVFISIYMVRFISNQTDQRAPKKA